MLASHGGGVAVLGGKIKTPFFNHKLSNPLKWLSLRHLKVGNPLLYLPTQIMQAVIDEAVIMQGQTRQCLMTQARIVLALRKLVVTSPSPSRRLAMRNPLAFNLIVSARC